jgi:hypothetical protein
MTIPHDILIGEALMGFVFDKLELRYRASPEPQVLRVRSRYASPLERGNQNDVFAWAAERNGLGGGAEFAPSAVRMKALAGDFASLKGGPVTGTDFSFDFEVASLSPKYLRNMIESMRPCVSLSMVGDLPLDDTPLSITELDMQKWVPSGAKETYLGLYEPVPFPVEEGTLTKGASLRIFFEGPLDPGLVDRPAGLAWRMSSVTGRMVFLLDPTETKVGSLALVPRLSKGTADLAVKWERFNVVHEPARALLLNMCTHIHETVQPVKKVVLKLP